MAEESENVGGINIEASVSDTRALSQLEQFEQTLKAAAERLSASFVIHPTVGGFSQQQAQQQARQARQQPAPVATPRPIASGRTFESFRPGSTETAVQRLAREAEALQGNFEHAQKAAVTGITTAAQTAASIPITVDQDALAAQMGPLVAAVEKLAEQLSAKMVIQPTVAAPTEAQAAQATRATRSRLASQDQSFSPSLSTREAQAASRRAQQTEEAARRGPAAVPVRQGAPTPAEAQFFAALQGAQLPRPLHEEPERPSQRPVAPQPTGPTVGTQQTLGLGVRGRSPQEQAAFRAEVDRQAAEFNARGQGQQGASATSGGGGAGGGGRGRIPLRTETDIDITAEQRLAQREAEAVAAGRTLRTQESSLGGFLAGRRNLIKANVDLQAANEKVRVSERRLLDPQVLNSPRAKAQATEELNLALRDQAKALETIKSFSTPFAAARNLAGIAVAGLAFGAGLKAVDFALAALTPAFDGAIDQMGGFGITSTKVTSDLAKQTSAMNGNVSAVLAQAEAQAGLSASAADALDNQLKLTTQIKAGATAAQQAGGLFRAGLGTGQGAPQGLLGGYGGVGGGAFLAQQLGGGAGLAETIQSTFADISREQAAATGTNPRDRAQPAPLTGFPGNGARAAVPDQARLAELARDRITVEQNYNEAAKRGAISLGIAGNEIVHFGQATKDQVKAIRDSNLPEELKNTARDSKEALFDASNNLILSYDKATKGLEQVGAGLSLPDAATFGRIALAQEQQRQRYAASQIPALQAQQAYERPSQIAAAERQQQFALKTQQPAEQALQNLAQPLAPVGTGIAAQDQASVAASLQKSAGLQSQLNAGYAEGRAILQNTYQVPLSLITQIADVGQQIVGLQAGIANENAAYQAAQFNYQLHIARRTLADIGGLTGKNFGAGESYLGTLERQNLALSRQAQLLQFALAQRQINFQTAVAGFSAPGVTPEERQANVKEAQIEADYAQKQLDIQKQMFGNQVQIVDISNLRQGADLAAQIGLLLQGRQLTIDTAAAQEQIALLQTRQTQLVNQAGTYLTKVNTLVGTAFSQIQQLEAAAGKAMVGIATDVLGQFGIFIQGLNSYVGAVGNQGGKNTSQQNQGQTYGGGQATGGLYSVSGATGLTVGEAGSETVAILRNARSMDLGSLGGGGSVTINFNGDIHANQTGDLDKITAAVISGLGRRAAMVGLRGTN